MIVSNLLFCFIVLYGCSIALVGGKQRDCSSCMFLRQCPEALSATTKRDQVTLTKFAKAFCGFGYMNGKQASKVCCSDFVDLHARLRDDEQEEDTDIETHKNIALLPTTDCGRIDGDRIIGGEIANIFEFPWMALISYRRGQKKTGFACGGSIINPRYILTAAHCVHNKNIAGVRVGEYDISTKEDCQGDPPLQVCSSNVKDIRVEKMILHEGFQTKPAIQNDIALLRLKKPIQYSKNIQPICLPIYGKLRNLTLHRKIATVAGWGIADFNRPSSVLRKVKIPIKSEDECKNSYAKNADSNDIMKDKFCAGEEGKDSCRGDSGGPLMLEEEFNGFFKVIQFGVVSFGSELCGSTNPGFYSAVTKYMKWILDNIEE